MNFFDLHCDTVSRIFDEDLLFSSKELSVNSSGSRYFGSWYQCFALFIDENEKQPFLRYCNLLKTYYEKVITFCPQNVTPLLTVEGGTLLENDIGRLELLKKQGVFSITLTWNGENQIAGGCKTNVDLKPFGIEVIKEMNNIKICCDLSHLNQKSFYSAVDISDYPIATHSCVGEVFNHPRNLKLQQMNAIKEKNGIIGICLYPEFLGGNTFEQYYKHISFCLDNGLENNISVGSDFDGCKTEITIAQIPKLYGYLHKKGIKEDILNKIFFDNAFNYFKFFDKQ